MSKGVINYNTANTVLTVEDIRRFAASCDESHLDDACIIRVIAEPRSWWQRLFGPHNQRITHIKALSWLVLDPHDSRE